MFRASRELFAPSPREYLGGGAKTKKLRALRASHTPYPNHLHATDHSQL